MGLWAIEGLWAGKGTHLQDPEHEYLLKFCMLSTSLAHLCPCSEEGRGDNVCPARHPVPGIFQELNKCSLRARIGPTTQLLTQPTSLYFIPLPTN